MTKTTETSAEIRAELEQINARINEVRSQADSERTAFENAQAEFVSGKGELDDSLRSQQKVVLLDQNLNTLTAAKGELEQRLKQAIVTEEAAAERQAAAKRATRRSELKTEFEKLFLDAANELQNRFDKLLVLKTEYNHLRSEDAQTTRGGSLTGIGEIELGVTHDLGPAIFLALNSHAHKANRRAEKERAAAREEQRRERAAAKPKPEAVWRNNAEKVSSSVNH